MLWGKPFPHLGTRSEVFPVKGKEIHGTKKDIIGKNWVFLTEGRRGVFQVGLKTG